MTQPEVYATESHKRQRQQTCRDKHYGHSPHTLRYLDECELLPYSSKQYQCQGKTEGRGESIYKAFHKSKLLLYHQYGHAKHGTVGCDKRKEYAKGLIESRRGFLQYYLHHLHD